MNHLLYYLWHYWPFGTWFACALSPFAAGAVVVVVSRLVNKLWAGGNWGSVVVYACFLASVPAFFYGSSNVAERMVGGEKWLLSERIQHIPPLTMRNILLDTAKELPSNAPREQAAGGLYRQLCEYVRGRSETERTTIPCKVPQNPLPDAKVADFLYRQVYLHRDYHGTLETIIDDAACRKINQAVAQDLAEWQYAQNKAALRRAAEPAWALMALWAVLCLAHLVVANWRDIRKITPLP